VPHPSTGLPELDLALGGLYWGDNVAWLMDGVSPEPFFRSITEQGDVFDGVTWISVARDPGELRTTYPGAEILDARPGAPLAEPADVLAAIRRRVDGRSRHLLLFDPLEAMAAAWGVAMAARFFETCCPRLLALSAVAYWSVGGGAEDARLRETVQRVTQCVLHVDARTVSVDKAEGRPDSVRGHRMSYSLDDGRPVLAPAPVTARVAASLRTLLETRGIRQAELARLAGVTPSAISQAQRGDRGLSLETLVRLCRALGISLDELLRMNDPSDYRIGRRDEDPRTAASGVRELLAPSGTGPGVYLIRLAGRGAGAPDAWPPGRAVITVAAGLVQLRIGDATPSLRRGEALETQTASIGGWRNLGDSDAMLFCTVLPADRGL
jgi:transcriptional regulator with XRE-family HTH domain